MQDTSNFSKKNYLKRWVKQWRTEVENRRAEYSVTAAKAKEACVDGKRWYNIM